MLGIKVIEVFDRSFRDTKEVVEADYIRWRKEVRDKVLLNYDYTMHITSDHSIPRIYNTLLDDIENQTAKALMSDIC